MRKPSLTDAGNPPPDRGAETARELANDRVKITVEIYGPMKRAMKAKASLEGESFTDMINRMLVSGCKREGIDPG